MKTRRAGGQPLKGTLVGAAILAHNTVKRKQNLLPERCFADFIRLFWTLTRPEVADYRDSVCPGGHYGISIGCVDATNGD